MKKWLYLTLAALIATGAGGPSAMAVIRNIQDNHQLIYNVIDSSGDHVTGETVTLKIKRMSDGDWFDFNDSTFKVGSWTSKSTNLTEDSAEGYYYYTFNPPASETGAEEYLFCYDNASATYGDHQCEQIAYQAIGDTLQSGQPTNFSSLAIDGSGQVTAGTVADKTGYSISGTKTTLDALNDIAAADVWSAVTRTLTALDDGVTTVDLSASTIGTVSSVGDKTGYSLTQTFPTNFSSLAITAAGKVTVGQNDDKTGYQVTSLTAAALANLFDTDSGTVYGSAVSGSVVKEIADNAGGSGLTAASIADAVWDEMILSHTTSGSTGEALNNAGAAGNPWATDISTGYTGQAGEYLRNIQDATDGDKESGSYTGIENMIRVQR